MTLVLETLEKADIKLYPEKCIFHAKEVKFLNYILIQDRIKIDPAKVKAVLNWPIPKTVTEVQEFIGFANFYRRFIKGYSGIVTPLTNLIKKDKAFSWTKNKQFAFEKLKRRFSEAPILAIFNSEQPIIVKTDASDYAIRAYLIQIGKDSVVE
jgi:hypothetical protein